MMDFTMLEKANADFLIDYFAPPLKSILGKLRANHQENPQLEFPEFFDELGDQDKQLVNSILMSSPDNHQPGTFDLLIQEFHKKHWKTMVSNVKEKITTAQKAGNTKQVKQLLAEFQELKKTVLMRSNRD